MLYISILNYRQVILGYDLLSNDLSDCMRYVLCCSCYCAVLSMLGLGFGLLVADTAGDPDSAFRDVICYI